MSDFKVLIIGAGNINFGSEEGPWNHSKRLEECFGSRLKVIGLVDPATSRATAVLETKRQSAAASAYASTRIYSSVKHAVAEMGDQVPDVIVVGCPPAFRGTLDPSKGFDTEVQLNNAFPDSALFVEKPISTSTVDDTKAVAAKLQESGAVISVGYMLRYCKAVTKMKEILKENDLTVMMTSARYVMAYEYSLKPAWWNKSIDCGPIVEQATHFCDLSRYFGGEVDLSTVMAHSVEWYEKPGKLSKLGVDESKIPEDDRIPRFTSATWKYESGAIGHLEHGVALQGTEFSTEITVFADGYQLKLNDPYNRPTLYVRAPGKDTEEVYTFHDDDPFFSEMRVFTDAATAAKAKPQVNGSAKKSLDAILSSYEDAVKTYEFTWAIRWASEKTRRPRS